MNERKLRRGGRVRGDKGDGRIVLDVICDELRFGVGVKCCALVAIVLVIVDSDRVHLVLSSLTAVMAS